MANTATVGQVTVIGPQLLYVYARQGVRSFSYQDESEVIAEGKPYRVILDPSDDDSTNKPGDTQSDDQNNDQKKRRHKGFLFVLLGVGAAVGSIIRKFDETESSDHP